MCEEATNSTNCTGSAITEDNTCVRAAPAHAARELDSLSGAAVIRESFPRQKPPTGGSYYF